MICRKYTRASVPLELFVPFQAFALVVGSRVPHWVLVEVWRGGLLAGYPRFGGSSPGSQESWRSRRSALWPTHPPLIVPAFAHQTPATLWGTHSVASRWGGTLFASLVSAGQRACAHTGPWSYSLLQGKPLGPGGQLVPSRSWWLGWGLVPHLPDLIGCSPQPHFQYSFSKASTGPATGAGCFVGHWEWRFRGVLSGSWGSRKTWFPSPRLYASYGPTVIMVVLVV